ncbi:Calx-beta domain-containing protein [Spirochaetota bacterium]
MNTINKFNKNVFLILFILSSFYMSCSNDAFEKLLNADRISDKSAPVISSVTIESDNNNSAYAKIGDTITITIVSDELLVVVPTVTLNIGGTQIDALVTEVGNSYIATYTLTGAENEGNVTISITNITDIYDNQAADIVATTDSSSLIFYKDNNIQIDYVSVSSNNNLNATLAKVGDVLDINFTSAKHIGTPTVYVDINSTDNTTATVTGGPTSWRAAYTLTSDQADGNVTFLITGIQDLAGNDANITEVNSSTDNSTVTFDGTVPSFNIVTMDSNFTNTSYAKVGDTVTVVLQSLEDLNGTPTVQLDVNGTLRDMNVTGSGSDFNATYTFTSGDDEDNVTVRVTNYWDRAGNAGSLVNTTTDGSWVLLDRQKPTLESITYVSSNPYVSGLAVEDDNLTITIVAGEALVVPPQVDLNISGTIVSADNVSGSGLNWTATYTFKGTENPGKVAFTISNYADIAGFVGDPYTEADATGSVIFDKTKYKFTTISSTGGEGISTISLLIELTSTPPNAETIDIPIFFTMGGTASNGTDYTVPVSPIIVSNQSGTTSLVLTINNEPTDEYDENVTVDLTGPNADASDTKYTYTIEDDDDPPNVSFITSSSYIPNEVSYHTVTFELSAVSGKPIDINVDAVTPSDLSLAFDDSPLDFNATIDGDVLPNNRAGGPITVRFNAGQTQKTIQIYSLDDTNGDTDHEQVIFELSNPVNVTLGALDTHTMDIYDDDGNLTLSVENVSVDENSGNVTVTIVSAGPTPSEKGCDSMQVNYQTFNGSAFAGSDYTSTSGTLTWTTVSGPQTFTIPIIDNDISEKSETIIVSLSGEQANGACTESVEVINRDGIVTINDDDNGSIIIISKAETLDCDPVDGYIDHYKLTFSRDVLDSTFSGHQLNSEGDNTDSWVVTGYSNVRLDHGSVVDGNCTEDNGSVDTLNDNVLYLKFDPSDNVDTGNIPDLIVDGATLVDEGTGGKIYYDTGKISSADLTEQDSARPYISYVLASDGPVNVGLGDDEVGWNSLPGKSDKLVIKFSESINTVDLSGIDLDDVFELFTVANVLSTNHFGDPSDINETIWSTTDYLNDTLSIGFFAHGATLMDGDTDPNDANTIKLIGDLVKDLSDNNATDPNNVMSPPAIQGTFNFGPKGPRITNADYFDTDLNGHIDHVRLTFDTTIDTSTFPGWVDNNSTGSVTTNWKIQGYNNVRIDTRNEISGFGTLDDDNADQYIWLAFSEGADYDTGAKPDLTSDENLTDLNGTNGCPIYTTVGQCSAQNKHPGIATTDVNEKDAAKPIMIWSTGRVDEKYVYVKFSENIWGDKGMPTCGAGGELKTADFDYLDSGNPVGATDITSVATIDNCGALDGFVKVLTDLELNETDFGSDKIGPTADLIFDAADNNASTLKTAIYETSSPYVMTASSYCTNCDNSTDARYFFRVVFSEPMDYTTATTASNYEMREDTATSCTDISSTPISVTAVSTTVYDIESDPQCGYGHTYQTFYKVTVNGVYNINNIEPVSNPNIATTWGTSGARSQEINATDLLDRTPPQVVEALSIDLNTVKLTFSEPMSIVDLSVSGSTDCENGGTVNCDVDSNQTKYVITPTLGSIEKVERTGNPSVYVVKHQEKQTGSYYALTVKNANVLAGTIPRDLNGNDIGGSPYNQVTFRGKGSSIEVFPDGPMFSDPFADGTSFSFAFDYNGRIYLGPNDYNSGAFRFEPDAMNPVTVSFKAVGISCPDGTTTFGYGAIQDTCNDNMGPNGERGVVGFNAGTVTLSNTDYDILMVGPILDNVWGSYFTQDVDTQLNWTGCEFGSFTGGGNTASVQTSIAFGDSYYVAVAGAQINQAPFLFRQKLTADSNGTLSCSGTGWSDLDIKNVNPMGKSAANPAKSADGTSVVGIDSMIYISSGMSPSPQNTFYIANNGGVAYETYNTVTDALSGTWTVILTQANLGGVTLVLPYEPEGIEKVRPGKRGMPAMVVYKNAMYMARNLAVGQTSANQVINNGAELWKCTTNCTATGNWVKVLDVDDFSYLDENGTIISSGTGNNIAIGFLQVNGDSLYMGLDNPTHGVTFWKTSVNEIDDDNSSDGQNDFQQEGVAGFGYGHPYIFSSASLDKLQYSYIYVTVGDDSDAIRVLRQRD